MSPKTPDPQSLVFSLSGGVQITFHGQEYRGTIQYDPSGVASLAFEYPEELSGLTCFWQGDHFQMTYHDLSVQAKDCPLPSTSPAALLMRLLQYAQQTGALTPVGNGVFEGVCDGLPFTLTAAPDGTIQELRTRATPAGKFAQFTIRKI